MPSNHVFSLHRATPQDTTKYGSRLSVTAENFPILEGMSLYKVNLPVNSFREPHWHPNAHELTYCLKGQALVGIYMEGGEHQQFIVNPGDMFFIPSGALHYFENISDTAAEFMLCFSSEHPEDFGISGSVGCMLKSVMGNTWMVNEEHLDHLHPSPKDILFGPAKAAFHPEERFSYPQSCKFSVESMTPPIANAFGNAKTARKPYWPILEGLSMYSLRVCGDGMREPHWHPQTAELGYVVNGSARMTIRGPGKDVDTYTLSPGDCYFIPKGYPHHIENLGNDEMHFLVFFDQAAGQDLGYSGAISALPQHIIEQSLFAGRKPADLALPTYPKNAAIVKKSNPVEGKGRKESAA